MDEKRFSEFNNQQSRSVNMVNFQEKKHSKNLQANNIFYNTAFNKIRDEENGVKIQSYNYQSHQPIHKHKNGSLESDSFGIEDSDVFLKSKKVPMNNINIVKHSIKSSFQFRKNSIKNLKKHKNLFSSPNFEKIESSKNIFINQMNPNLPKITRVIDQRNSSANKSVKSWMYGNDDKINIEKEHRSVPKKFSHMQQKIKFMKKENEVRKSIDDFINQKYYSNSIEHLYRKPSELRYKDKNSPKRSIKFKNNTFNYPPPIFRNKEISDKISINNHDLEEKKNEFHTFIPINAASKRSIEDKIEIKGLSDGNNSLPNNEKNFRDSFGKKEEIKKEKEPHSLFKSETTSMSSLSNKDELQTYLEKELTRMKNQLLKKEEDEKNNNETSIHQESLQINKFFPQLPEKPTPKKLDIRKSLTLIGNDLDNILNDIQNENSTSEYEESVKDSKHFNRMETLGDNISQLIKENCSPIQKQNLANNFQIYSSESEGSENIKEEIKNNPFLFVKKNISKNKNISNLKSSSERNNFFNKSSPLAKTPKENETSIFKCGVNQSPRVDLEKFNKDNDLSRFSVIKQKRDTIGFFSPNRKPSALKILKTNKKLDNNDENIQNSFSRIIYQNKEYSYELFENKNIHESKKEENIEKTIPKLKPKSPIKKPKKKKKYKIITKYIIKKDGTKIKKSIKKLLVKEDGEELKDFQSFVRNDIKKNKKRSKSKVKNKKPVKPKQKKKKSILTQKPKSVSKIKKKTTPTFIKNLNSKKSKQKPLNLDEKPFFFKTTANSRLKTKNKLKNFFSTKNETNQKQKKRSKTKPKSQTKKKDLIPVKELNYKKKIEIVQNKKKKDQLKKKKAARIKQNIVKAYKTETGFRPSTKRNQSEENEKIANTETNFFSSIPLRANKKISIKGRSRSKNSNKQNLEEDPIQNSTNDKTLENEKNSFQKFLSPSLHKNSSTSKDKNNYLLSKEGSFKDLNNNKNFEFLSKTENASYFEESLIINSDSKNVMKSRKKSSSKEKKESANSLLSKEKKESTNSLLSKDKRSLMKSLSKEKKHIEKSLSKDNKSISSKDTKKKRSFKEIKKEIPNPFNLLKENVKKLFYLDSKNLEIYAISDKSDLKKSQQKPIEDIETFSKKIIEDNMNLSKFYEKILKKIEKVSNAEKAASNNHSLQKLFESIEDNKFKYIQLFMEVFSSSRKIIFEIIKQSIDFKNKKDIISKSNEILNRYKKKNISSENDKNRFDSKKYLLDNIDYDIFSEVDLTFLLQTNRDFFLEKEKILKIMKKYKNEVLNKLFERKQKFMKLGVGYIISFFNNITSNFSIVSLCEFVIKLIRKFSTNYNFEEIQDGVNLNSFFTNLFKREIKMIEIFEDSKIYHNLDRENSIISITDCKSESSMNMKKKLNRPPILNSKRNSTKSPSKKFIPNIKRKLSLNSNSKQNEKMEDDKEHFGKRFTFKSDDKDEEKRELLLENILNKNNLSPRVNKRITFGTNINALMKAADAKSKNKKDNDQNSIFSFKEFSNRSSYQKKSTFNPENKNENSDNELSYSQNTNSTQKKFEKTNELKDLVECGYDLVNDVKKKNQNRKRNSLSEIEIEIEIKNSNSNKKLVNSSLTTERK